MWCLRKSAFPIFRFIRSKCQDTHWLLIYILDFRSERFAIFLINFVNFSFFIIQTKWIAARIWRTLYASSGILMGQKGLRWVSILILVYLVLPQPNTPQLSTAISCSRHISWNHAEIEAHGRVNWNTK